MRGIHLLALLALLAPLPPATATCASTTLASACVDRYDSEVDHVGVTVVQHPGPAGSGYTCTYAGASAVVSVSEQDADGFGHACAYHSDGFTGTTFSCWSLYALDNVTASCSETWNDNGIVGRSGVTMAGGWVCVTTAGVSVCGRLS